MQRDNIDVTELLLLRQRLFSFSRSTNFVYLKWYNKILEIIGQK